MVASAPATPGRRARSERATACPDRWETMRVPVADGLRRVFTTALVVVLCACGPREEVSESDAPDESATGIEAGPDAIDVDEVAALRALGYVEVGEPLPEGARTGVIHWDRERAAPGLTVVTNSHFCRTEILDLAGKVLHSWTTEPCERWGNTVITPEGDLLVVGRVPHGDTVAEASAARYLMRLAWDGSERWRRFMPAHHDVDLTPEGRVSTLTYEHRQLPQIHPEVPVRDHAVVLLTASGEPLEQAWLSDLLRSSPDVLLPKPVEPRRFNKELEVDEIHANSLEWLRRPELAEKNELFSPGRVLICFRHQDMVAIFDWARRELVWAWGRGELSGPHDATLLANGNILVFDNGLGRRWSRVVEVDPLSRRIVWEYRAPEPTSFYTGTRGATQRLSNGNTLITESRAGRAFEVTRNGEIVWDYRNPNLTEKREPSVLVRARRIEGVDFDRLQELVRSGRLPFVD